MPTNINCPYCGTEFDVENVLASELDLKYQKEYQKRLQESLFKMEADKKVLEEAQRTFEEKRKKENEMFLQKIAQERKKMETEIQEQLRKSISSDFENKITLLESANRNNEEQLKMSRHKELEFLKKEQNLMAKEQQIEISIQKQLIDERHKLSEQIRGEEMQKVAMRETEFHMKMRELEKQLDDQKKLAEEMRRKADQGSMQLQGEAQELLLEEILRENFPFDLIVEVGKGVEGADCMQIVRNSSGHEYGKIIFESKRAKGWNNNWIDKLRNDMRSKQADIAILVTQVFPKNMTCFGEKDGIWICTFKEVAALTSALRNAVIRIAETKKTEENKGEKMQMLYNFLTGIEFRQQVEAIVEGFVSMKNSITKERIQMEKMWKEREKQLEKVLISTSGMYGSIKGIAGSSIGAIPLLEGDNGVDES
jgi:hypothetical protein